MQTALAVQRIKELTIKKALGQTLLSNTLQTAQESFIVLASAVLACGFLLNFVLNELEAYTNLSLKTGWLSDQSIWWFLTIIFLTFWIMASVISAILLSFSSKGVNVSRNKSGNTLFRKGLIGLQFALAGFFILNALVISQQLEFINDLDLGYEQEGLITVNLNGVQGYEHATTIKNSYLDIAGVKQTSISQSSIFGNQGKANFAVQVDTGLVSHMMNMNFIDPDFLETSQMTLLAGENIRSGNRSILLNEKAVETLGFISFDEALGKQMTWSGRDTSLTYVVSGIISDYHYTTMHQAIEPIVLLENELGGYYNMTIRTEGQSVEPIITELQSKWNEFFPGHELSYRIMDDVLDRAYEEDYQKGKFYQYATLLLVAISALGIFGLTYYYADQKRKEIGVRKAIGAQMSHIIFQIARPITLVCSLAVLVAIPIAVYFSQRWLEGYVYGIELGFSQIAITVVLMFVLSSIALLYPGIKASRINPVEALRED